MGSELPSARTVYTADSSFDARWMGTKVLGGVGFRCSRVSSALNAMVTLQQYLSSRIDLNSSSFENPGVSSLSLSAKSNVCCLLFKGMPHWKHSSGIRRRVVRSIFLVVVWKGLAMYPFYCPRLLRFRTVFCIL